MTDWLPVAGWPTYAVSDDGQARGPQRLLKPFPHKDGYLRVCLRRGIERRWVFVHIVMLETFVGPKPDDMESRHLNGKSDDNRVSNLAWGTHSQNVLDQVEHGTHNMVSGSRWK